MMYSWMLLRFFFVLVICTWISAALTLNISIDTMNKSKLEIRRFWTSTGFSPTPSDGMDAADFFLSKDEELNLSYIGSLPNRGITHVRIHWLLDLVKATCPGRGPSTYDFTKLDKFIRIIAKHELKIGFELMGNPLKCFRDWKNQYEEWHRFIYILLQRYIDEFGTGYVQEWRFETINEPDLRMYNRFNMSLSEYMIYVKATAAALAHFNVALWGPAGLFKAEQQHPFCWGLLQYCQSNPCPVQVFTFHRKGDGVSSQVVTRSQQLITDIKSKYPKLENTAFANDEADPMTGWIKPAAWRADVRYAAAVVQIFIGLLKSSITDSYTLAALSNDNGFLSYFPHAWSQRTLLARFQMNNTKLHHVQMFRKPVYFAMELLSLLGHDILAVDYEPGKPGNTDSVFLELKLSVPSVTLINLCPKVKSPGPPDHLEYISINENEILLLWKDTHVQSRCLLTYIVEFRQKEEDSFTSLVRKHFLSTAYQFDGCLPTNSDHCVEVNTSGTYRVAALDIWGQAGPFSQQLIVWH